MIVWRFSNKIAHKKGGGFSSAAPKTSLYLFETFLLYRQLHYNGRFQDLIHVSLCQRLSKGPCLWDLSHHLQN